VLYDVFSSTKGHKIIKHNNIIHSLYSYINKIKNITQNHKTIVKYFNVYINFEILFYNNIE